MEHAILKKFEIYLKISVLFNYKEIRLPYK